MCSIYKASFQTVSVGTKKTHKLALRDVDVQTYCCEMLEKSSSRALLVFLRQELYLFELQMV